MVSKRESGKSINNLVEFEGFALLERARVWMSVRVELRTEMR